MIVFELICPKHHRFEGWFASSEVFDSQKDGGLLACPSCGRSEIEKLPTAKIRKAGHEDLPAAREEPVPAPASAQPPANLQELIDYVLMNTENVGSDFPSEARRIHKREVPYRHIRGIASRQETDELLEEGIPVMALPVPPQSDWH